MMIGAHPHLTYKGNLNQTRHGWLRLTPAYSVHLVAELLNTCDDARQSVLDPFCGTGTTALVCAERGIPCHTTDINPFLIWLSQAKTARYSPHEIAEFTRAADDIATSVVDFNAPAWSPPIHQIDKWWSASVLSALSRMMWRLHSLDGVLSDRSLDLLKVAFCRVMIEHANVSFGHQSMSFRNAAAAPMLALLQSEEEWLVESWRRTVSMVGDSATIPIASEPVISECDARHLALGLPAEMFSRVVTSPPYPNRMSYIRELRPYMYWLGYLADGRQAGELDWQAIGGTWGIATSKVGHWIPDASAAPTLSGLVELLPRIGEHSPLLARYVQKYFYDMRMHINQLPAIMKPGGTAHYIVGNSKFYDVVVPVEHLFAEMFDSAGFERIQVEVIRKRSSKRELFEYVVSAQKPAS